MKIEILLISIVLLTSSVQAQNRFLETNKSYDVAKIYLNGTAPLKVKDLNFINDTLLRYSVNGLGFHYYNERCPTTNIRYIAIKNGSHALGYGMVGGLSGLLVGSLVIYSQVFIEDNPDNSETVNNPGWLLIGSISGGVVVGALIGLCIPKWEVLYIPDKKTSFFITPKANLDYCGLGLTINF
jgi:hypothetical protein